MTDDKKGTDKSKALATEQKESAIDKSMELMKIAVEAGADSEKIKALMDMRRELQAEAARRSFHEAKSAFLSAVPVIKKRKNVSFKTNAGTTNYWYAPLEDIVETIKPYLQEFGFSFSWQEKVEMLPPTPGPNNKSTPNAMISVKCVLTHVDGHSEECVMPGMLDSSGGKNPIQMLASSSTYLRRYTLTGVAGIATADEDVDGRVSVVIGGGSVTLDEIQSEGQEDAATLKDEIMAASSWEELHPLWQRVTELPDGAFKESCKAEFLSCKKLFNK